MLDISGTLVPSRGTDHPRHSQLGASMTLSRPDFSVHSMYCTQLWSTVASATGGASSTAADLHCPSPSGLPALRRSRREHCARAPSGCVGSHSTNSWTARRETRPAVMIHTGRVSGAVRARRVPSQARRGRVLQWGRLAAETRLRGCKCRAVGGLRHRLGLRLLFTLS